MRLYRKVIPKIAREIISQLNIQNIIEVEEGKVGEAELDLAAVMVEHLNSEDRIIKEAKEAILKRQLSADRFPQIVKAVADARNVKIGSEGLEDLLNQMLEVLFASKNIVEIYSEDRELRKAINGIMDKYISIPEAVDQEARNRLKNVREGTPEWEIEYPRMVSQLKRQKGLS